MADTCSKHPGKYCASSLICHVNGCVEQHVSAAPPAPALRHEIIAGALFDFMGMLTTSNTKWRFSSADDAAPGVQAIREFAGKRGLSLDEADVKDWRSALSSEPAAPAPQQPTTESAGDLTDTDRLEFALQHVGGGGWAAAGVFYSAGCTRADIDAEIHRRTAKRSVGEQPQPSLQQRYDELRRAVIVMTNALESGEWAELFSQDPDASALESAITKLVGAVNIAQPVAPDLRKLAEAVREAALLKMLELSRNGIPCKPAWNNVFGVRAATDTDYMEAARALDINSLIDGLAVAR